MKAYEHFKEGFWVGYVVSAGFVTASFISYYFFNWLNYYEHNNIRTKSSPLTKPSFLGLKARDQICKFSSQEVSDLEKWIARMSYGEIIEATDDFNEENIVGVGKMGTVYKAVLKNGTLVAVKRLNPKAPRTQLKKHFTSEIKSVGRLRHNNLVPLLGFCIEEETSEIILVYKFMPNGNLRDWLNPTKEEHSNVGLEWPSRLRIAIGVARALAWLHHGCGGLSLAHLDISSRSILLDLDLEPKISNFSRAIFTQLSNYLKNDVYNFGFVLLELITLKERAHLMTSSFENTGITEEQPIQWVDQIKSSVSTGLENDEFRTSQTRDYEIFAVLDIATKCIQLDPNQRPSMLRVYKRLRAVGERFGLTYDSGMLNPPQLEVEPVNMSNLGIVENLQ